QLLWITTPQNLAQTLVEKRGYLQPTHGASAMLRATPLGRYSFVWSNILAGCSSISGTPGQLVKECLKVCVFPQLVSLSIIEIGICDSQEDRVSACLHISPEIESQETQQGSAEVHRPLVYFRCRYEPPCVVVINVIRTVN